uniref:Uncharacterized protein n=1 Tax=Rhizophora mucronata TaxID=61149 RepID=A0A2P2P840_RHIMU
MYLDYLSQHVHYLPKVVHWFYLFPGWQ